MIERDFSITVSKFALRMTLFIALFLPALASPQKDSPEPMAISRQDRLKVFDEAWQAVNKHYFDPQFNGVNWERVKEQYRPQVEAANNKIQLSETLQKMLDELGSSHLNITVQVKLKKQHVEQELGRKVSRKESLLFDAGMEYVRINGKSVISAVANGSSAQLAGVQRGWALTHWNGEPYLGESPFTCELDQKVEARFLDLQGKERSLALTCKLYPAPPSVPERVTRQLDNGAVYLRFSAFTHGTEDWLAGQMTQARSAPAIVIDLRGNGGGLLVIMQKCLEPFFSQATTLGEHRERNGKQQSLKVGGRGKNAYRGLVIVLIDEMTASAAEIFAAALQETGRALVVGRQSDGDVLGSLSYSLSHSFRVNIPIWDYQTAKGIRLEKRGVTPDERVPLTLKDFLENRDLDLEHAQKLLQKP